MTTRAEDQRLNGTRERLPLGEMHPDERGQDELRTLASAMTDDVHLSGLVP